MATYTPKLNLIKPDDADFFSRLDQNGNMDIIDGSATLNGTTAPTTATVGIIGQFYLDTGSEKLYQCVSAIEGVYGWVNMTLDSSIGLSPDVATALGLTGNPQVKDALAALQSHADSTAQTSAGSYIGTGTYGTSNPSSLTFDFEPKFVEISESDFDFYSKEAILWWAGLTTVYTSAASQAGRVRTKVEGNTFSWNTDTQTQNAIKQLNEAGTVYYFIAIG